MTLANYEPKTPQEKADMAELGSITRHMSGRQLDAYCEQGREVSTYKQRVRVAKHVRASVSDTVVFRCVGVGCVNVLTVEWTKPCERTCPRCKTTYGLKLGEKPGEKLTVLKAPNGAKCKPQIWLQEPN